MTAKDRISVRVDEGQRQFLRQIGHDDDKPRGAISRGVAAVIAFAQMTPLAFKAFLNGRADPEGAQPWGFHDKFKFEQEADKCASDD